MDRKLIFTILVISGFTIVVLSLPIFFPLNIVMNSHFFVKYSGNPDNETPLLRQMEERNHSITIEYTYNFPVSVNLAKKEYPSLKDTIKNEYPGIDDPATDNWTKVRMLRNWANSNINYAFNRELTLDSREKNHYYQKNATEIFDLFHNEKGGVMCGGTAYALQQLYELYGFEAYTVNMGKIGNFTHVITLVKISNNNQSLLSVQDAYSDISYTKPNDQPIDYFEMLNLLKNHQDQLIKIEYGPNQGRTFFWGKNQIISNKAILLEGLMYCNNINFTEPIIISNNYVQFRGKMTYQSIDQCNRYRYVGFLNEDGYPASQIYLFMYPFSIMSKNGENEDLLRKAKQVISHNSSEIS
jgi:hypothetical protein